MYNVPEFERVRYIEILYSYYKFYKKRSEEEAKRAAVIACDNALKGKDIEGNDLTFAKTLPFDLLLSKITDNFYVPQASQKMQYPPIAENGKKKKVKDPVIEGIVNQTISNSLEPVTLDEQAKIEKLKKNLLSEYPNLNRSDLETHINNYALLSIKIERLLIEDRDTRDDNMMIKNYIDSLVKLGEYLGIDEGKKAEAKNKENQDSIASLIRQFDITVKEYPDLQKKWKYEELKILLSKYDRNELSKALFILDSYAGMSIEEARAFVESVEKK